MENEKAMAISAAMEEKAKAQEEKELEEAIRLSNISHQEEVKIKEKDAVKEEEPKKSMLGNLPPLVIGTKREYKPIEEFKKDEEQLKN